jgi:hypothetical protein
VYVNGQGGIGRFNGLRHPPIESRYVASVPVRVQRFLSFGPFVTRGVTLNISMRGMSALVCGAPRVGETVVITVPLSVGTVEMLATVRHSSEAKSGFEFYPLSASAQEGIHGWIQQQERQEQTLIPYLYAAAVKYGRE